MIREFSQNQNAFYDFESSSNETKKSSVEQLIPVTILSLSLFPVYP
jgi:hypothetical protein